MNKSKYLDGYLPKIVYHLTKGNKDKVQYFYDQQVKRYGPFTCADYDRLGELLQKERINAKYNPNA
tara:strand:+ start:456 stop:653 length:198 start_codon:yes stop_codon:yes gene_type:complete